MVAVMIALMSVLLLFSLQQGAQGARMLSARVEAELPPCKDVPGGIPGFDCFDPPTVPLPPCDFHHQRPGFDCWPKSPPAANVMSSVTGASAETTDSSPHRVEGALPPCKDVPGGIPGFDCTPPFAPLPPCDYNHQNPGVDCWLPSPPATKTDMSATGDATTDDHKKSTSTHEVGGRRHVEGALPPCKDVPGGIPGFDCFEPPKVPLPPCDFHHQRPGVDCWPPTAHP